MAHCKHHPGRQAVLTIHEVSYCAACRDGIVEARRQVPGHVVPKDCFVTYQGSDDWEPIPGTGCAHWVAHQLGIAANDGEDQCLEGCVYLVKALVKRTSVVPIEQVRVNDIYVTLGEDHAGLVLSIRPAPPPRPGQRPADPTIIIRHDSSGQGHVADNDFAGYFHGRGTFRRL